MTPAPGLYEGTLRHRRFLPRGHAFEYRLFMALLDIDAVPETMGRSWLTSHNRWNWASFDDRDHLAEWPGPLRDRVAASSRAAGESLPDGPIYLLTHLRYAGYVFNPISIFYCHDRTGTLQRVLAEVSNTYGGRRCYWLRPQDDAPHRLRATSEKTLYVSPFMPLDVTYEFLLTPPGDDLVAHMNVLAEDDEGRPRRTFDATLQLSRQPWTAATVRRALVRFPIMTAQVILAIHWQALRLWMKGLPVQPFPAEGPR